MKLAYTDKRLKHDLGFIAWGGNNGTAQIYLTGECCTYLNSLGLMGTEIYPLMVEYEAKITRADLAYDDFTGSIPIEDVYDYWRCGHFTFTRTPTYEQVGTDWFNPTKKGRSCYVGNAKNGKVLNVYEKGRQLGDRDSPWVRWELRLGNKDRIIPLEVALNPGSFFKGAYPMFNSFIDLTPALAIKTLKKKVSITINDSIRVIKNQFGKYINVLRNLYGDSHLLKEILIEDVPKRLIFPSPVLSVDLSEGFDLFHHDLETDETFYA
jgi:phage replication initiation protein